MSIYKKKLGYPFPFGALVMGLFVLLCGISLLTFSYGFGQFFGGMLTLLAVYMCFLRSEIWVDSENKKIKFVSSMFGLKWGYWILLENYAAITIKYTLLTDKGYDKVGGGLTSTIPMSGRFYNSQYNKQESWKAHFIDYEGKKIELISGDKNEAVELINQIMGSALHLKPYLSNYRKEFELSKEALKEGKIVLKSSLK
jgi:hypothetical protein